MTGRKRLSSLCLFIFSFLFYAEKIDKYNRIALFAGRRTIRIMNYHYFPFRGRRFNYVENKKKPHRIFNVVYHKNTKQLRLLRHSEVFANTAR